MKSAAIETGAPDPDVNAMTTRLHMMTDEKDRHLGGPDKAAALLLALGKPLASQLLKHFDANELRDISRSAASLGALPISTLEELVEEFAGQFSSDVDLEGTAEQVEHLLTGVLPTEQIAEIMSEVLGNSNQSIWQRLSTVSESVLSTYLEKEHPQIIALILSRLSPSSTAAIMGRFPKDLRNELVGRILNMRPVMESVLRVLEKRLHEDLLLSRPANASLESIIRLADVLNRMTREDMEDAMRTVEASDPAMAKELRKRLFSFEDIVKVSSKDRAIVFEKISTDIVILALRKADPSVTEAVLSSLAARGRRMVEAELASGSAARAAEITKAQSSIAQTVLDMVARGEIEIGEEAASE